MKTRHRILFQSAQNIENVDNESVHLVVTSPPYPMIEMWDEIFSAQNPGIKVALDNKDGTAAFDLMHHELEQVWKEMYRVLIPGGIVCINIGDATRTIDKNFRLFNSHARIIEQCIAIGFQSLPAIIWRKQTNAPNKFMGSGMLPPGAYVTLEHEYILIFRKGRKREFKSKEEKEIRRESTYFWEERNLWFSDLWDFKGVSQLLGGKKNRERSAAYPFELAFRLTQMFSVKNDTVLDPFVGTGTTTLAAMISGRNSVGIDIDENLMPTIDTKTMDFVDKANQFLNKRIEKHLEFVSKRTAEKGELKYMNEIHNFPVMTRQELKLTIQSINEIKKDKSHEYSVSYRTI